MGVVTTDFEGGIAVITINRPDKRNAVNRAVAQELAAAVDEVDARADLAAAIVTGAGGTFSSGMDLRAFTAGESPVLPGRGFGGLTQRPPSKPLIAAVEGWALAGGFELALACDLIVAATDSTFGLPETKRGLVAAGGGVLRLAKVLPYQLAMELVLTGDPLDAVRAHHFGLVNALTPPGAALDTARALAARIAANGPLAVRASKKLVSQSIRYTDADAFRAQLAAVEPVQTSQDAREGARAFAEKRPPVWRGI